MEMWYFSLVIQLLQFYNSGITNSTVWRTKKASGSFSQHSESSYQFESKFSQDLTQVVYVKGYEYESLVTKFITVDKGRYGQSILTEQVGQLEISYILKVANGFFDISKHSMIDLHSVTQTSQNVSGDGVICFNLWNTVYTKIISNKGGTFALRTYRFLAISGDTSNTSHYSNIFISL